MRWHDLLRGRTITSPADIPTRYVGHITLQRLDPDALGIRTEAGRPLTWDDPALDAMGVSVVDIVPVAGAEPAFAGDTAHPGTTIDLQLEGRVLRAFDEHGLVLGDARDAELALAQLRAGHRLHAVCLRQVRVASGVRTQLQALVVPEGVSVQLPVRHRERR